MGLEKKLCLCLQVFWGKHTIMLKIAVNGFGVALQSVISQIHSYIEPLGFAENETGFNLVEVFLQLLLRHKFVLQALELGPDGGFRICHGHTPHELSAHHKQNQGLARL